MIERLPAPRSETEIKQEWLSLFPPGRAFSGHNTQALIGALAKPHFELEEDLAQQRLEICPGTSIQLLSDYQKLLGPDPFWRDQEALPDDALRQLLQSRWIYRPSQTIQSYIDLAASFGTKIWIEEPDPSVCGDVICGDGHEVGGEELMFIWIVHLPAVEASGECGAAVCGEVECGDEIKEPYQQLIRVFELLKPADTEVYFEIDGEDIPAGALWSGKTGYLTLEGSYLIHG